MEYTSLGRTGVQVSRLCLGCMNFGWKTDEAPALEIMNTAIDAGINFFDTANVYSRGKSEEIVGKALRQSGKRDQIVLATKVHGKMDDSEPNAWGNSRRHIIQQCEASLKRLQTDRIDLYQIHRPQPQIPIDETLRALDDLIHAGKVRYIGTSTFAAYQLVESLWASKELGLNRFVCEQPPYNLFDRRIERELLPMAATYGFAIIPWSPLAGGFLTGKYKKAKEAPKDSRYADSEHMWYLTLSVDRNYVVIEALEKIAKSKNCTLSQLALAWCAQQPHVTTPIIGPRTLEQLKDNLAACDVQITDQDREKIDEVVPPGSVVTPYYEADFGPAKYRW